MGTKGKESVVGAKVRKAQRLQAVAADMASVLKETAVALASVQRDGAVHSDCEGSLAQCAANRAKLEAIEASKEASAAVFDTSGEKDTHNETMKSHDVAIEAIREMENNTQVTPKNRVIRLKLGDELDNVTAVSNISGAVNITASLPNNAKEAMEKAGKEVSDLDAKAEKKINEVTEQLDSQRSRSDIEDAQIAESQEAKKQAEYAEAQQDAKDDLKSDNATTVMRRLGGNESPITSTGVNASEVEDAIKGKSRIIASAGKAAGQKQTNGTQANKDQAEKEEKVALEEAEKDKEMVEIAKEEVAEAEKSGNKAEVDAARKEMVAAIDKEGKAIDKAKKAEKEAKEAGERAVAAAEGASAASGASGASGASASGTGDIPTEKSVKSVVDKALDGPAPCMPVGAPDHTGSVTTFGGNSCLADLSFSDAAALCASHKAHICSHNELKQSFLSGHSSCTCGWTSTAASGDKFLVESVMASSGGCGGAASRGITICDEATRSKTFGVHCCAD